MARECSRGSEDQVPSAGANSRAAPRLPGFSPLPGWSRAAVPRLDFREGGRSVLTAAFLDHLPEARIAHREKVFEVFSLDAYDQSCRLPVPGDEHAISLRLVDVLREGRFRLADGDDLH